MTDLSKQKFILNFSALKHYAGEFDLDKETIHKMNIEGINALMGIIMADATIGGVVYLGVVFDEVFVSCNIVSVVVPIKAMIEETVKSYELIDELPVYFFECTSYEDSYKTALDMQEEKELCYEKK